MRLAAERSRENNHPGRSDLRILENRQNLRSALVAPAVHNGRFQPAGGAANLAAARVAVKIKQHFQTEGAFKKKAETGALGPVAS